LIKRSFFLIKTFSLIEIDSPKTNFIFSEAKKTFSDRLSCGKYFPKAKKILFQICFKKEGRKENMGVLSKDYFAIDRS